MLSYRFIKKIVLGLLLVWLSIYHAMAEQFQPAITDTQWEVNQSPLFCRLTQPINDFGHAMFEQKAGGDFSLVFTTYSQPAIEGHIKFQVAQATWQNDIERHQLSIMKTQTGQMQFKLLGVAARQALNHINEGRFPIITYTSRHSQQAIHVLMSTVHLKDYLPKFEQCLAQLFSHSFEDLQYLTIHFELEQSQLGDNEIKALQLIVDYLKIDASVNKIQIIGHTDNHGKRKLNQILSEARANSIKQFFLDSGIEESKLVTLAKLEQQPIKSNKTQQGRAYNRRAEIILFR